MAGFTENPDGGMKNGTDRGIVVYSTASYPPHPWFIIYTIIAGALEFARSRVPRTAESVEIRLLPMGIRDHLRHAWFARGD